MRETFGGGAFGHGQASTNAASTRIAASPPSLAGWERAQSRKTISICPNLIYAVGQ